MAAETTIALAVPIPSSLFKRSLPMTVVLLGVALTLAWTAVLGYGFVSLVLLAL